MALPAEPPVGEDARDEHSPHKTHPFSRGHDPDSWPSWAPYRKGACTEYRSFATGRCHPPDFRPEPTPRCTKMTSPWPRNSSWLQTVLTAVSKGAFWSYTSPMLRAAALELRSNRVAECARPRGRESSPRTGHPNRMSTSLAVLVAATTSMTKRSTRTSVACAAPVRRPSRPDLLMI